MVILSNNNNTVDNTQYLNRQFLICLKILKLISSHIMIVQNLTKTKSDQVKRLTIPYHFLIVRNIYNKIKNFISFEYFEVYSINQALNSQNTEP